MHKPVNAHREIELKFSIAKNRFKEVRRFLSSLKRKDALQVVSIHEIEQKDIYFDSQVFDLAQHHCSLRIRETDKQRVITFKRAPVGTRTALTDRTQIEGKYGRRTLARITKNTSWLLLLSDSNTLPAKTRVKHTALHELGLYKVLSIENKRTVHIAEYAEQLKLELCFDRVQISDGTVTHNFFEMEVEYVSGDISRMEDLEKYLRTHLPWLRSSKISKYERSLKSLKIWKRKRAITKGLVAKWRKRLNKVLVRFNKYYALTLQFKDEEDLHKCRVALRQLITLLNFLGDGRKETKQLLVLKRRFKKIQKILGRLRDLDVYLMYAEKDPLMRLGTKQLQSEFLHLIELERDQQRLDALAHLPKYVNNVMQKEWDTLMSSHLSKLARDMHSEEQFVALVSRFKDAHRALIRTRRRLGPAHPKTVKQLHRTRILAKNLRYASEYLDFALPGNTKRLVAGLTNLQDSMGEINDIFNHIGHTVSIADQFQELLSHVMQPQIDKMQAELVKKLKNYKIEDLTNIIGLSF